MNNASAMSLTFAEVSIGSDLYREALDLRNQILREPLGLVFTPDERRAEAGSSHLVALMDKRVVACVVLTPEHGTRDVRLRQFAVQEALQRKGIGRLLCGFAESFARSKDLTRIFMHARLSAASFYEGLGYLGVGDVFEEVSIPHIRMDKLL